MKGSASLFDDRIPALKEGMCNHVFKPLWYVCDDDYGITTNKVYLETRCNDNNKGHLAYCTKCGQVFVREIAICEEKNNDN